MCIARKCDQPIRKKHSISAQHVSNDKLSIFLNLQERNPHLSAYNVLYRVYPYKLFLKDGVASLESLLTSLDITPESSARVSYNILSGFTNAFKKTVAQQAGKDYYIQTDYQNRLIQEMSQTAAVTDFCLVGPAGCGKTILLTKIADLLEKQVETIILYQDMTSRDLLQQRTTLENGDTVWKFSPLVIAALEGKIAVLDGLHRIHPSTLSVLHRLVFVLFSGTERSQKPIDSKKMLCLRVYRAI